MLNVSTRKVGGIRFLKIGRLNFAFSISRANRIMKDVTPRRPAVIKVEGVHLYLEQVPA